MYLSPKEKLFKEGGVVDERTMAGGLVHSLYMERCYSGAKIVSWVVDNMKLTTSTVDSTRSHPEKWRNKFTILRFTDVEKQC